MNYSFFEIKNRVRRMVAETYPQLSEEDLDEVMKDFCWIKQPKIKERR
jgi:hypothetical protein